jgi:hypothetical protein
MRKFLANKSIVATSGSVKKVFESGYDQHRDKIFDNLLHEQ